MRVSSDQIESFLSICPKPADITLLYNAVTQLGVNDFESALAYLDCGKVEQFMLSMLVQWPHLHEKAMVIQKIYQV